MAFEWLRRLLKRADVPPPPPVTADEHDPRARDQHDRESPDLTRRVVALIGPNYDELTAAMEAWLRAVEVELNEYGVEVTGLYGSDVTPGNLQGLLQENAHNDLFVVFYGHGVESALCTSPAVGQHLMVGTVAHGKLCDASTFAPATKLAIAAFCCHAASALGQHLRRRHAPVRFLGFTDFLSFVLDPEAQKAFARPMSRIVIEAVALGELTRDACKRLDEEYAAVTMEWVSGAMVSSDRALLVSMFLDEHREVIDGSI